MTAQMKDRPDTWTWLFLGLGLALLPVGLYLALAAPPDANQGYLARIMYLHVPGAWLGYLAFFVTFLYSLLYLFRQDPRLDRVALASAEIGLVFMGLALVTGMLWARPTWGVYWTWDPGSPPPPSSSPSMWATSSSGGPLRTPSSAARRPRRWGFWASSTCPSATCP